MEFDVKSESILQDTLTGKPLFGVTDEKPTTRSLMDIPSISGVSGARRVVLLR
jgi:hypothetical protein